jgi:hypothetical protein
MTAGSSQGAVVALAATQCIPGEALPVQGMGLVADLPVGILPAVGQAVPMIGGIDQVVGGISLNLAERWNHTFTTSVPNPLGGRSIGAGGVGLRRAPHSGQLVRLLPLILAFESRRRRAVDEA